MITVPPMDEHNERLVSNAAPSDWVNPKPEDRYNLVVVGAGTAGLVCAAGAAGLGAKVALIERRLMGGDCLVTGCVPSKTLLHAARMVADARHASEAGIQVDNISVDFGAVMQHVRAVRGEISLHDSAERFRKLGVDVFFGDAHFTGEDTVEVKGATLRFGKAVVATGARAAFPPIAGLAESDCLTNETVFSLTKLPGRLLVIGGGPIGCELAQAFCRLGSSVTLVESTAEILPREDTDAAAIVAHALQRDGVELWRSAVVDRVERRGAVWNVLVRTVEHERIVPFDEILVCTGRTPNMDNMGLDRAGVRFDAGGIVVDDYLQTTNPHVFAAGDVCMTQKFTHAADATARIVIQNALFGMFGKKRASMLTIPWCTYTDPEIAHVGLSERDALKRNIAIDTIHVEMKSMDRAITDGERAGLLKIHVAKGTDRILGATLVGRNAGDIISEITLAMTNKIGLAKFAAVIHPYPTRAEIVKRAADQYNRTRLTPNVRRFLAWILARQRR